MTKNKQNLPRRPQAPNDPITLTPVELAHLRAQAYAQGWADHRDPPPPPEVVPIQPKVQPAFVDMVLTAYTWGDEKQYPREDQTKAAVTAYIDNCAELALTLQEAPSRIWGYFPSAPLWLSVLLDPENGSKTLRVRIGTALDPREANDLLANLSDDWRYGYNFPVGKDMHISLVYSL